MLNSVSKFAGFKKVVAFTVVELFLIFGIIGVVAILTIPVLLRNHNKKMEFARFAKAYSQLVTLWEYAETDFRRTPECAYWGDTSPYKSIQEQIRYDQNGNASWYYLDEYGNETPLPSDYNGKVNDCTKMKDFIISHLKINMTCKGNAYASGCIGDIDGNDTLAEKNYNPNNDPYRDENNNPKGVEYYKTASTTGVKGFRKSSIINNSYAYVTLSGFTLIGYGGEFSPKIFAIDTNGPKKPNKWGHDVFAFTTEVTSNGTLKLKGYGYVQDKGTSAQEYIKMIKDHKKPKVSKEEDQN